MRPPRDPIPLEELELYVGPDQLPDPEYAVDEAPCLGVVVAFLAVAAFGLGLLLGWLVGRAS